mgnify:CR=1 FL=1
MGFLANKRILITGLLSNRSIAYGVAQAMKQQGAELAFTYVVDKLKDRVVEMAWEDRTPFDAIAAQFGCSEQEVIALMRRSLKPSSFRMWRKRVQGRSTKHLKRRSFGLGRFTTDEQIEYTIKAISETVLKLREMSPLWEMVQEGIDINKIQWAAH